jgi:phosphoglycolate phosphatase-like HAD superfamily hydrolase
VSPLQTITTPVAPGWDNFDAYLFDIDGTLMREPNRVHVKAFTACLREILERDVSLDGVTVHGSTDAAILRDACRLAGVDDAHWQPLEHRIFTRLAETVHAQRHRMEMVLMPSVVETLEYLAARGAILGVGTGNLESIGWLKLEQAGIRSHFSFGGFSDRYAVRADMIAHAAQEARKLAGPHATLCVVGDTPSDVTAAHANGIAAIAVATSIFSVQELAKTGPEWVVPSLQTLLDHTNLPPASSNGVS